MVWGNPPTMLPGLAADDTLAEKLEAAVVAQDSQTLGAIWRHSESIISLPKDSSDSTIRFRNATVGGRPVGIGICRMPAVPVS